MTQVSVPAIVQFAGITVSSINDRIRPRPGYTLTRCYPSNGFFVIVYRNAGGILRVYFNQDGKEVFAESTGPLSLLQRCVEWLKSKTGV